MAFLTIQDETLVGNVLQSTRLEVSGEQLTVRELITARVTQEVERYNRSAEERVFKGLVQPGEVEQRLNVGKHKVDPAKRLIDAEKQCYVALSAFQKNGFIVLVDHKQVEDLEERIVVRDNTTVSFVKLTPLVGG